MDTTTFDTTWQEMKLERLDARRLKDLEILHTAIYGRAPQKGMYKKKYDTGYTGHTYLGFIAYTPAGDAAAYYGVIPCFVLDKGKLILAAQSADTMTHPLHRRKGLFVLLAKKTYQLCRDEYVQFLFGFPNQHSYPTFINILNWQSPDHMDLFVLPVRTFPLQAWSHKLTWTRWLYKHYIQLVTKRHRLPLSGLPNGLIREGFAGVYRDDLYLRYKTYHPSLVVSAGEAKVWIKPGASLFVGDVDVQESQFDDMIRALIKLAKVLGIGSISFQVSQDTFLHRLLAERCPPQPSFPVIVMDLGGGLSPQRLKFAFADIDIF